MSGGGRFERTLTPLSPRTNPQKMMVKLSILDSHTGREHPQNEEEKKKKKEDLHEASTPEFQEDRLGLDYTVLCFGCYVYQFGRTILEGCSDRNFSRVVPMEIRPPGFLVTWLVVGINGSVRCSGDALIL